MSKRRNFSAQFKQGAFEHVRQPGISCVRVAQELGIGASKNEWSNFEGPI